MIKNFDKYLHFGVGLVIGVLFSFINPYLGVLMAAIAGWIKEKYDKMHPEKHTSDGWDAYATVIGGIVGVGIMVGLMHLRIIPLVC